MTKIYIVIFAAAHSGGGSCFHIPLFAAVSLPNTFRIAAIGIFRGNAVRKIPGLSKGVIAPAAPKNNPNPKNSGFFGRMSKKPIK